jgi:hypothetical protein
MLSVLAGSTRMLCSKLISRGQFREEKMWAGLGGLLRVPTSQERGVYIHNSFPAVLAVSGMQSR